MFGDTDLFRSRACEPEPKETAVPHAGTAVALRRS
jgi:hypothetical protein